MRATRTILKNQFVKRKIMSRDNFTKPTIELLGKRCGFLCSNPDCRKHTIGPNEDVEKTTLIGVAAHITAASPGGPRYDENLMPEQRIHINNGIWLCSNCATLIDKDPEAFPVETLNEWRSHAENEMKTAILGNAPINTSKLNPFIEVDLIWANDMRVNKGYSQRNVEKFGGNFIPVGEGIIFWELTWRFNFTLHNNSSFPAFNIRIIENSSIKFDYMSKLPTINNLPPFGNLDLEARCMQLIESDYKVADEILKQKVPTMLNGMEIIILYEDENRKTHKTIVRIEDNKLINIKE